MARARFSLKRTLLFSTFLAVSLLSAAAMAATTSTTTAAAATTTSSTSATTTSTTAAATTTDTTSTTDASTTSTEATTSATGTTTASITATGTTTDSGTTTSLPTDSGTSTGTSGTTSMPTLTSTTDTSIPTYPAPSVPPTQNAPFMQQSNYPDGTVFIAVGSILGAFGLAVLVWRGVVAYLLHRSIRRAAMAQHIANDKAAFPSTPTHLYKYSDRTSMVHTSGPRGGSPAGRGVRRTNRGPTPSATPSQTNLFFSPTAPGTSGLNNAAGNRDSRHLPSGFYAAGSGSPAGAGYGTNISMSNLRVDPSPGRAIPSSPPDSPAMGPRSSPMGYNASGSSLNLNRPPSGGRAPSAFLDDLLDDQPHLFPPAGGPPPHGQHGHSR